MASMPVAVDEKYIFASDSMLAVKLAPSSFVATMLPFENVIFNPVTLSVFVSPLEGWNAKYG